MRPARRPLIAGTMKDEWLRCPRCKTLRLQPQVICTETNGNTKYWWLCPNYNICNFPLDMPKVFHVTQSAVQKSLGTMPTPNIENLPQRYHYMYPITFPNSRSTSRCSSVLSNTANSRNDTSSDGTVSEKSSGQNRLKADSVHSAMISNNNTSTPSTSARSSEPGEHDTDNIDEDIEAAAAKSSTCRTVRRKRPHDPRKSWAALIEKVASDPRAADSIINMEESELFSRMKEFFESHYLHQSPISYKRAGIRPTYRFDDVESCLRAVTQEDWKNARRRMPYLTVDEQTAMKTSNAREMLKSVGIDLEEKRKAVGEKVGKVMRGFSAESLSKRQKIQEDRLQEQKQKEENRQVTIHQSVSARILNKKLKRDEEERSLSSTPASFVEDFNNDFSAAPTPEAPATAQEEAHHQVHFHLGNNNNDNQGEDDEWNFDFDGLYEDINAQNAVPLDVQDPIEAIISQLDDPNQPEHHHELLDQVHEHSGDEGEKDDNDEFTGFRDDADFGVDGSNFDFVNDNFNF